MKLATIETIAEILPHPNADRLEVARVLGWQTVVKKSEFQVGARAVFVVIDTLLPAAPWSAFLADPARPTDPIRLRTARLRGQFSQGLLLPLDVLPEPVRGATCGTDVGEILGIRKYEKILPAALAGTAKAPFPSQLIPRTDEDNGLSAPDLMAETCALPCRATLKLDGSSCTIVWKRGEGLVEVCSRNWSLLDDGRSAYWKAAQRLDFSGLPPGSDLLVLQGELMGPGVQGNQLRLTEPALHLFSARLGGTWLGCDDLVALGRTLGAAVVPEIRLGALTLAALQALADAQKLPSGAPAEGIVVRADPPVLLAHGRPAGFKIINRNYGE